MANILRDWLGNDHPLFAMNVARLERASGDAGVDTRLIADITQKAHELIREIGLDSRDTQGRELYLALNSLASRDNADEILKDASYVLVNLGDGPISFNLNDINENVNSMLSYEQRSVGFAQRKLRAEIIRRYAAHDRTSNTLVYELTQEAGLVVDGDMSEIDHSKFSKKEKEGLIMENEQNNNQQDGKAPYILAVGDINTNAFIKMNEDHGQITTDEKGYTRLSIEMGGKIPYDEVEEFRAGECSPNAAVSMTRLGLKVDLMTWLGDDEAGVHMIDYLKDQGVGTEYMVVEEGQKSNYHYVLRFGADRTKLQKFEDYKYEWREPETAPDWIYLGVLGENTWHLHEAILDYLARNPETKLIFQPGMYHLMWGAEKLAEFYRRAELVIMNREETAQVTGRDRGDLHGLIEGLHELGVSIAVVTDGADGAYASDGSKVLFMPNYPDPAPPYERTGAGDAFASTLSAALAYGQPLEEALRWAPINSAYVVQQMGAQRGLLMLDDLKGYLANAPDWYHSSEFERQ